MNKQERQLKRSLANSARLIRDEMEDKQFFTSGRLTRRFSEWACAITGRYDGRSRVNINILWSPQMDRIGFAMNNNAIYLNIGHTYFNELIAKNEEEIVQKLMHEYAGFSEKQIRKSVGPWHIPLKREVRYELLSGLFGHEMGHILYTNGNAFSDWISSFENARLWYPVGLSVDKGVAKRKELLESYIRKKGNNQFGAFVAVYAKKLMNCIEDGYIEARLIREYPGMLGYCVQKLRMFSTAVEIPMETVYQDRADGKRSSFETILAAILKYSTTQTIYWGNVPHTASERIRFDEIRPLLDQILHSHNMIARLSLVNQILIRLANELVAQIQDDIQNSEDQQSVDNRLKELLGSMADETKDRDEAVCKVMPREDDEDAPTGGGGKNSGSKSDQFSSHTGSEDETNNYIQSGKAGQNEEENRDSKEPCQEERREPSETETDPYDEQEDELKREVDALENEVSLDEAAKKAEEARMKQLLKRIKKMKLDANSRSLSVELHRPDPIDASQYELVAGPLKVIAKKMGRTLLSKLHEKRNMQKVNGLYMGRKLEAGNIVKNDGRLFSRKRQPADGVEMAVGVIIDESGSMSGEQYDAAKKMAILLYEFCHDLGFPIVVYGHNARRTGTTSLYSYVEFDAIDGKDPYRILTENCHGCNRDGAALRYMAERLFERQEQIKVLIIVSDGLPSSYDSMQEGIADVQDAIASIKKKDIVLVTAGLGESREQLSMLYQDHFLDISDLESLPVTLVSMLKRYIEKVL